MAAHLCVLAHNRGLRNALVNAAASDVIAPRVRRRVIMDQAAAITLGSFSRIIMRADIAHRAHHAHRASARSGRFHRIWGCRAIAL